MKREMPAHATLKDISATFNEHTIPRRLQADPGLPPEIWAEVAVAEGEVELRLKGATARVTPGEPACVPPGVPFGLRGTGKPVRFCLRYYHEPVLQDGKTLASKLGRRGA